MSRDEVIQQCYLVPGQTWPTELGWLYDEIQHSKSHAEIGTFCGRSLLASCGGMLPSAQVVSVDNFSDWVNKEWVESVIDATLRLIRQPVRSMRMHSCDAGRILYKEGCRFDSVFIDGDHHYAECKADIQVWSELIKPGGLICGHDYWAKDVGVMDAVNECLPGFQVFSGTRIWFKRLGR